MKSEKFFRKSDWIAALICFSVALLVYGLTLQPTVGVEDSGELIVASDFLGVPHPPGYPIWSLLTWFFQWIFHAVTFHGYPNPAWAVNFFSGFAGAAACGIIALLISRSGIDLLHSMKAESTLLGEKTERLFCAGAGIAGGLLLAFSQGMWSQAVIAEVYTLNIFFQSLVLLYLYRWICEPKQAIWLILCTFALGLGVTNHQTLLFMGIAVAIAIFFRDSSLFRDFVIGGVILLIFFASAKIIDSYAGKLSAQVAATTHLIQRTDLMVQQQGLLNTLWYRGWNYAGFWVFLTAMLSIPALLAVRPSARKIAFITLGFILFFTTFDLAAKHDARAHKNLQKESASATLSVAQYEKIFDTSRGSTLRIYQQEIATTDPSGVTTTHTLSGFKNPTFVACVLFLLLIPGLIAIRLPHGTIVCATIYALFIGLAFYLYMPFASDQNPPINWGYPRTWEGFVHAVTRGQYEQVIASNVLGDPGHFLMQVRFFLNDLGGQFTIPLLLVGFLPFTAWKLHAGQKQINGFLVAVALLIPAVGLKVVENLLQLNYPAGNFTELSYLSGTLSFLLFVLFGLGFGLVVINAFQSSWRTCIELFRQRTAWNNMAAAFLMLVWFGVTLISLLIGGWILISLFKMAGTYDYWEIMAVALWIVLPPIFLALAVLLKKQTTTNLHFNIDEAGQHWFIITIIAFVSVGFTFLVLQNPKTDVQSLLIGRVQYIQSHAIYALWLGYGLLLFASYVESLFKNNATVRILLMVGLLGLPVGLIAKNRWDPTQLHIYGGVEQNGHDFGWQFGHWQLQGVKGIEHDLRVWHSPEEFEKIWADYPNKNYPEPMGPNAIFFGGTDPGRFVPTYMIYSAKVRPDVYLITQNALADNTYMNVMRDLYGDQIWIPTNGESDQAFQIYVEGVRSGKIQAGADVVTENGKIQIRGVGGVMKINGYLSQWIFERNQYRTEVKTDEATRPVGAAVVYDDPVIDPATGKPPVRTFYVEESYAIPWMTPYLTPNGLIMKINAKPTPLTDEMVKNDTDFWNWYTARLLNDERFMRDVFARRTFCKLRSSLAGLLAARGRPVEAEAAFKQALALYDLSPEAAFRMADLLLKQNRIQDAIELLDTLLEKDPQNDKIPGFRTYLQQILDITNLTAQLEQKRTLGPLSEKETLLLLDCYFKTGRLEQGYILVQEVLDSSTLTAAGAMQIAQYMAQLQKIDMLEKALHKYTELEPNDPNGWLNLAAIQLERNQLNLMWESLDKALELSGTSVRTALQKDARFNRIRNLPAFIKRVPPATNQPVNLPFPVQFQPSS